MDPYEGDENDTGELDALFGGLESGSEFDAVDSTLIDEFRAHAATLNLEYFKPEEFLFLGVGHSAVAKCSGKNSLPPRELWANSTALMIAMDAIRKQIGARVRLTNVFRNPSYNKCVGGVPTSQHCLFKAADFVAAQGVPADWAHAAREVRASGIFSGGIGTYSGFVHVDVRGSNVDWNGK